MAAAICANLLHAGYNISLTKTAISAGGKDRKEPLKTTKATELLCHACPLPAHTHSKYITQHEEAAAAARCHLIENKAFRHYFAYLFDLFLFFFKTDANCFRSERQRCNAIVDAINHG